MKADKRTYESWHQMKQRCSNKNNPMFYLYGGRGISFDSSWNSYTSFVSDMGIRPENTSLDRIENNGNYEKGNCKWSTPKEQASNRRIKSTNKLGVEGVRKIFSRGLLTDYYQAYVIRDKKFIQLYAGVDFFEACCAKKASLLRSI